MMLLVLMQPLLLMLSAIGEMKEAGERAAAGVASCTARDAERKPDKSRCEEFRGNYSS